MNSDRAEAIRQVAALLDLDFNELATALPGPGATPEYIGQLAVSRMRAVKVDDDMRQVLSNRFVAVDLGLSVRVWNALKNENILTVRDLFAAYPYDHYCHGDQYLPCESHAYRMIYSRFSRLNRVPNFGKKSYNELMLFLRTTGIPQTYNPEGVHND